MIRDPATQEELTAYLDGELSSEDRRRVEERLAREPEYRSELQRMQRAWDMLDKLPRATVDDSFMRTTIEMVAIAAADEARTQVLEIPRKRRLKLVAGIAAILVGAVVGFGLGERWGSRQDMQLLKDLPVVKNFELYRHADSVDFLRQLEASNLFDEEAGDVK